MYDYLTLVNRSRQGSVKWNQLLQQENLTESAIPPLSVADCDLRYPPELIHGLQEYIGNMVFGYSEPTPGYYDSIYQWFYQRHQQQFYPEDIVLSPGVVSALFNLVKTFTQPGDGVIIFSPVYYPFSRCVLQNGRRLQPCRLLRHQDHRYSIDFEQFEQLAADESTTLLIFCSPHNPIGRVWQKTELQHISDLCQKHNVRIISDEIHCDITLFGHQHTCFLDVNQDAIICTAPSKSFNLAGLQTSNIIFKNHKDKKRFNTFLQTTGHSFLNPLGMKACEIAYSQCAAWFDGFLQLIEHNHLLFKDAISQHLPQLKITPLEGTYLQWLNCQALGLDDKALDDFFRQQATLYLDAGVIFGQGGEGFTRFNIATPPHILQEALNRLFTAVQEKL